MLFPIDAIDVWFNQRALNDLILKLPMPEGDTIYLKDALRICIVDVVVAVICVAVYSIAASFSQSYFYTCSLVHYVFCI